MNRCVINCDRLKLLFYVKNLPKMTTDTIDNPNTPKLVTTLYEQLVCMINYDHWVYSTNVPMQRADDFSIAAINTFH